MKRFAGIVGMWILGLAALAVVAWLFEARTGRPLDDAPTAAGATLLDALAAGTQHTAGHAADALERGDRAEATHSLDAAMRALEVGEHNAGGVFEIALQDVKRARVHLARGQPAQAVARARNAADVLEAGGPAAAGWPAAPEDEALEAYEGATVLDLQGLRIGEVHEVHPEERRLEIDLGGGLDVFGFLDLWALDRVSLPADVLLFGPERAVGGIFVVLPVFRAPEGAGEA